MQNRLLSKSSPIVFGVLLLFFGVFYLLIKTLGYSFIPFNGFVTNIISVSIIIGITVWGLSKKDEKTKATIIFSALLPLIAIFFVIVRGIASGFGEENTSIYVIHTAITLGCSIVVFFSYGHRKSVKIGLGITYFLLLIPISFFLFIMLTFGDFGENTVVQTEMSPNSLYLAEVIDSDQGALGGDTLVNITRQNCDINLFIGKIKKPPQRIYSGRWGEFNDIALHWETDEILYINGKKYEMKRGAF